MKNLGWTWACIQFRKYNDAFCGILKRVKKFVQVLVALRSIKTFLKRNPVKIFYQE